MATTRDTPAAQALRQPEVRLEHLWRTGRVDLEIDPLHGALDLASAETTIKYAGYLKQQEGEVQRARKDEEKRVPPGFPFARVPGLSREVVQRLIQVQPDTLGHALRIPGITPAAVAILSSYLHRLPLPRTAQ